jgi:hypothetical protein
MPYSFYLRSEILLGFVALNPTLYNTILLAPHVAISFLKQTEYIHSTIDDGCSMLDVRVVSISIKLAFFWLAAMLNPACGVLALSAKPQIPERLLHM